MEDTHNEEHATSSQNLIGEVEALLFVYGDPITIKKAAATLSRSEDEIKDTLARLDEKLQGQESGLLLLQDGGKVQLATKPQFSKLLESVIKEEFTDALTPAALETLTIVCYTAPVTRAEIDYVRGVNSTFILRGLLLRGLIERSLDQKRGNAFVYVPSFSLLKHLGISRIEDLPNYDEFRELVQKMRSGEQIEDIDKDHSTEHPTEETHGA